MDDQTAELEAIHRQALHDLIGEHWLRFDPDGPDETWQCRLCDYSVTHRGPGY